MSTAKLQNRTYIPNTFPKTGEIDQPLLNGNDMEWAMLVGELGTTQRRGMHQQG